MNWRPFLIAAAIVNLASVLAVIGFSVLWRGAAIHHPLMLASIVVMLATLPVIIIAGLRSRMASGRRPRIGYGVGVVDIIEGVSGKKLSAEAAMKVRWITVGVVVLLLTIGVAVAYARGEFGG